MQIHLKPECEGCPNAPIVGDWAGKAEDTIAYLNEVGGGYEVTNEGAVYCSGLNHHVPESSSSEYCWVDVRVPKIDQVVPDVNKVAELGLLALRIPVEVPTPELIGEQGVHSRGLGSTYTGLVLPKPS